MEVHSTLPGPSLPLVSTVEVVLVDVPVRAPSPPPSSCKCRLTLGGKGLAQCKNTSN